MIILPTESEHIQVHLFNFLSHKNVLNMKSTRTLPLQTI